MDNSSIGKSEPLPPIPRGFWPLMFTQFQGAFSDNALKWLVLFLVFSTVPKHEQESYVTLSGALFAVPFLLFSIYGGWLADRVSKRTVMMGVKLTEIGIMIFATVGLVLYSLPLQMAAICLMGLHSTFFAPAKYGILPEVLPAARLPWGNGILELLTFVAIILGTMAGGVLAEGFGVHGQLRSGLLLAGLAAVGLWMSCRIANVPAAAPQKEFRWNFPREIWRQMNALRPDRDLWRANWGNTAFFFVAAMVQMNLSLFAVHSFHMKPTEQSWLQAALSLGIGLGSVITGQLSRGKIRYGFVPLGALLMALGALGMGVPGVPVTWFALFLAILGVGGGFFIVPVAAVLQHRPKAEDKGSVQGIASWLSWVGIIAASGIQTLLSSVCKLSHGQIFWFCGAVALVGGLYVGSSRLGWFARRKSIG